MMSKKMLIIIIVVFALMVCCAGYLWYIFFSGAVNPPLRQNLLTIGDNTWNVEIASTTTEKALGLSGRDGLGENDGMLFLFDRPGVQNFWMKDMKFPLDMIWISGGQVVGFVQDAVPQPERNYGSLPLIPRPTAWIRSSR